MARMWIAAIAAVAALSGCDSGPGSPQRQTSEEAEAFYSAELGALEPPPATLNRSPAAPQEPLGPELAAGAPLLAYSYHSRLEAPRPSVEPLMRAHEAACAAAGPQACQVIGASVETHTGDYVVAELSLRATPAWLEEFRAGLEAEASAAGGRIIANSVTSEDLTREIVDTAARVRALETLRGRLEALLRDRPGKLAELLELERELARVQGELDSMRSNLAVMRARVAMSDMTLAYQSRPDTVSASALAPISEASTRFLRTLAESLGALIVFTGAALPWVLVLGGLAYVGWRGLRRKAFRRKQPAPTATPDQ